MMKMFDTHIHTEISTDSDMKLEDAIKAAKEKNVGLIITEHMDINHPIKGTFVFDVEDFFNTYGAYRNDDLLLGIELGMTVEYASENFNIIEGKPFDYVLGSVHFLGNYDIYYPELYEGKTKDQVYRMYLKAIYDNIEKHKYIDSLGHIDYIARYSPYEDKELYLDEYKSEIRGILQRLIDYNIQLEINTRRLSNKLAFENVKDICKEYAQMGGKYVTIGSDSHNEHSVAINFKAAMDICQQLNLKSVYFKDRQMQYNK